MAVPIVSRLNYALYAARSRILIVYQRRLRARRPRAVAWLSAICLCHPMSESERYRLLLIAFAARRITARESD